MSENATPLPELEIVVGELVDDLHRFKGANVILEHSFRELQRMTAETENLHANFDHLKNDLNSAVEELSGFELSAIREDISSLGGRITRLHSDLDILRASAAELRVSVNESDRKVGSALDALAVTQTQLAGVTAERIEQVTLDAREFNRALQAGITRLQMATESQIDNLDKSVASTIRNYSLVLMLIVVAGIVASTVFR